MSARGAINPDQLRLFMTARELREQFEPHWGDYQSDETAEDLWDRKLDQSKDMGLHEDIEEIGVRVPVTITDNPDESIFKPQIKGGHHRIASAYEINPDMEIPVHYADTVDDAWDVEMERGSTEPVLQEHVKKKYGGFGKSGKSLNGW